MAGTRSLFRALLSPTRSVMSLCCTLSWLAAGAALGQPLERFMFDRSQMGAVVRVVLYAPDSVRAHQAAAAAFARIDSLNAHLSDWIQDSELNRLSRTYGQPVQVSDDLWMVLSTAQAIAAASEGHFDVTVGPLTRLWRWGMRRNQLPNPAEVEKALRSVGYRYLDLDALHQTARLLRSGMRLDLGGIAKGYAADEALRVLQELGYAASTVDAGGDMAIGAPPPNSAGWPVQITVADSTGRRVRKELILAHCGVAASGATYRFIEHEGTRFSHIVSPLTGMGITFDRIVTVVASSGMQADAWASAYSVMEAAADHAVYQAQLDLYLVQRSGGKERMWVSRNRVPE
ncbi:MAG: FAD:protein FMN transferase [Bacteroidota bacterium]|nr:FAD:protein FMN transferase [Bacteroidota bacterium]